MLTNRLQNSLKNFNPNLEAEIRRENDRIFFIEKFPLDKIKDLKLEEFVAGGGNKDSFCYWLEFKNILFGIGGGNASKFGLYKSNKNSEYYSTANKSSVVLSDEELPIYFKKLKSEIVLALDLTKQNRIAEIENVIDTSMWKIVLLKILTIYYPDKFLQIGSFDTLLNIATDFELNEIINPIDKDNIFVVNYELNKVIRNLDHFKDWNSYQISDFIWETYENKSNNNYYLLGSKYSNDGNFKDVSEEMIEKEVVSIGFASDYDLSEYYGKTQNEITSYLKKINENKNSYSALKLFLNLKVGDRIAIKSNGSPKGKIGNLTIIGYATVIDIDGTVYSYDKNGLGHMINVKHNILDKEMNFEIGGYGSTIHKLSDKGQINKIFYSHGISFNLFQQTKDKFDISIFNNFVKYLRKIISELSLKPNDERVVYSLRNNNINFTVGQRYCFNLYLSDSRGVYGVISKIKIGDVNESYKGESQQPYYNFLKEFNPDSDQWKSILEAMKDELNRTTLSGYKKYNNTDFENYIFENNLKLINSNNNMKFPLNTILYGPPGTGKTYDTILRAAQIIENREITSYSEALNIFQSNLHNRIEFITFHQNYSYEDFIQGIRADIKDENEQLKFKKSDGVFKVIADRAYSNIKESEKDLEEISQVKAFEDALEILKDRILESDEPIKINDTAYFTAVEDDAFRYSGVNWTLGDKGFNGFRMKYSDLERFFEEGVMERKEIKNLDNISGLAKQHATYFIKTFELVKSLMPNNSIKVQKTEKKNYVIIIDEINRANISRVFGELITLIEEDKRSHGDIPMRATLPSGDTFMVPSNLYIIGTMNTADKSIALLDIALRRRFTFVGMYPKYEIEDEIIHEKEYLRKINEKIIESGKGRDFQLGHSYFMGKEFNLVSTLNNKVIPLLMEYFMNDEVTVIKLLEGSGFLFKKEASGKVYWPLEIESVKEEDGN